MKTQDVPQDQSRTYNGHKKLLYAQSDSQGYVAVQSSGWEIEESATLDAVDYFESQAKEAAAEVAGGFKSPLYFHMYNRRMDLTLLAQTTGYFKWQIRKHFKPSNFNRLNEKKLKRYADALNLSVEQLKTVP